LTRIRARVATVVLLLVLPTALVACGGGSSSSSNNEDPNQVLKETFNNPTKVNSGNLNIGLSGSAEGTQSGTLDATISGPFQADPSNPNAFPQLDLTAKVSASGSGQSIDFDGSLIATKDNAFVEYQGQAYEVGTAIFQRFEKSYEQQAQAQGGNQSAGSVFKRFGIDPSTWLTNVSNEGETDVDGTNTIHIHGDADVGNIVADLGKVVQQTPGGTSQSFTPQQLNKLKSYVKDATVDVYSGVEDHLLHKLGLALTITPPANSNSGVSSVTVNFSVTLSDVNQTQTITAPTNAKPISGLLGQLGIGGLGAIGGAGSTGGATGGAGPSSDYLKCVQKAQTPDDYNKCAQLLQQ
jgi:hypothetical protein